MCCARWRLDLILSRLVARFDCSEKALEYCIKMAKESCCCSVATWSTRQPSITVITAKNKSGMPRFSGFLAMMCQETSRSKKFDLRKNYSNTWPFIFSSILLLSVPTGDWGQRCWARHASEGRGGFFLGATEKIHTEEHRDETIAENRVEIVGTRIVKNTRTYLCIDR